MFDQPKGLLWISGFTRTTFTIEAEISVGDRICAKAMQTLVFINQQTNRAIRLPQAVLDKLKRSLPPQAGSEPEASAYAKG